MLYQSLIQTLHFRRLHLPIMPIQRHIHISARHQIHHIALQLLLLHIQNHAITQTQLHCPIKSLGRRYGQLWTGIGIEMTKFAQKIVLQKVFVVVAHQRGQPQCRMCQPLGKIVLLEHRAGHQTITHRAQRSGITAFHRRVFRRNRRHHRAIEQFLMGEFLVVHTQLQQNLFSRGHGCQSWQQPCFQRIVIGSNRCMNKRLAVGKS